MPALFEMKQDHNTAIKKAEQLITAAEYAGRDLTESEAREVDAAMAEAQALAPQIATVERKNTLSTMLRSGGGKLLPGVGPSGSASFNSGKGPKVFSEDYRSSFHAWLMSGGQTVNAALYEGSNPAGGYAVPITVDDQIVPLAPQDTAIRQLATVLPTTNDLKIPRKLTFGAAALKAESGATVNSFAETDPTLDSVTLSAFMAGSLIKLSWELASDVPSFQAFAVTDMLIAQQALEEGLFVSGTGVGQAQGLLGNVGVGVTEEPDTLGNPVSIDGTLDLIGSLKAAYHENASFLMARPTAIIIRKAQRQANLFEPVWTRSNGVDYLHGYPVRYAAAMPAAARGASPILFGDFKQGYIIGDRGGSAINVKVLDQPYAVQGQIALLAYRRTDGRVRRSEAIQTYTIAAS